MLVQFKTVKCQEAGRFLQITGKPFPGRRQLGILVS